MRSLYAEACFRNCDIHLFINTDSFESLYTSQIVHMYYVLVINCVLYCYCRWDFSAVYEMNFINLSTWGHLLIYIYFSNALLINWHNLNAEKVVNECN